MGKDVWRQGECTQALVLQSLLRVPQSEPVPRIPVEAAKALEIYLGNPGVAAALRNATLSDQACASKHSLEHGSR